MLKELDGFRIVKTRKQSRYRGERSAIKDLDPNPNLTEVQLTAAIAQGVTCFAEQTGGSTNCTLLWKCVPMFELIGLMGKKPRIALRGRKLGDEDCLIRQELQGR